LYTIFFVRNSALPVLLPNLATRLIEDFCVKAVSKKKLPARVVQFHNRNFLVVSGAVILVIS